MYLAAGATPLPPLEEEEEAAEAVVESLSAGETRLLEGPPRKPGV